MRDTYRPWLWFSLVAGVVALDQASKLLALAQLDYAQPVEVLPVLNMTLHFNRGAAFSFLSDAGGWQRWFFSAIALAASAVLAVWLLRLRRGETLLAVSLSLIMGGALGNLWDRLQYGHVVDFISVHYHNWYFPTFNVADSAVSVGAALMILDAILQARRARGEA
ncbi:MAG: signal peptidase II [Halieaceae bacterium]|nr:signal peptidase II [Halieaceae bacterium]